MRKERGIEITHRILFLPDTEIIPLANFFAKRMMILDLVGRKCSCFEILCRREYISY